ncbi:YlbF/YmcA family competence regulator [Streptococcus loxodontisalivarius]|nr:YlbF/YmcA family competence regulator [Streptococcus loxodontisalivarius]
MANIYDLANELERAIRALPEYQAVEKQQEAFQTDPESKALFEEFVAFQQKLYTQMQTGQMPSQEDQEALQDLGQKIEAKPALKAFFDAQQALGVYINDIERIIFKPLQDLNQEN